MGLYIHHALECCKLFVDKQRISYDNPLMLRRERADDISGITLEYLPDWADKAIIGFAQRANSEGGVDTVACYGYQALKAVLRDAGYDVGDMYRILSMCRNTPGILMLYKYSRKELWNAIVSNGPHRWELLDSAVLGIGRAPGEPDAVVYSMPLSTTVLSSVQRWSSENSYTGLNAVLQAGRMLDNTVLNTYIGPDTPWFATILT